MAVYVDRARHYPSAPRNRFGKKMVMCHMLADTEDELHAMADTIGVARRWFQASASTPHYDVCSSKRLLAVKHGAVECTNKELVVVIRRLRLEKQK